jgi:transposase-like protein
LSKEGEYLTPKREFDHDVKLDVEARVRRGVKAVLGEVLQEEMTEHLEAGYRELTPTRRGELRAATTHAISSLLRARSNAWRSPGTARASSSLRSSSATNA